LRPDRRQGRSTAPCDKAEGAAERLLNRGTRRRLHAPAGAVGDPSVWDAASAAHAFVIPSASNATASSATPYLAASRSIS
jgi:hypothetical protein